jgi:hypothetical protein
MFRRFIVASIRIHTAADGSTYKVQVRIKGFPPRYATFDRKTDAKRWAIEAEAALHSGRTPKLSDLRKHTVRDLCDRYLTDILPTKSNTPQRDQKHLLVWWKDRIGSIPLSVSN